MKTVRVLLMVALAWLALPASVSAFYNPSTGRWLNRDPIGTRGGPNEFAFTKNCPVCNVDRLGQQIVPPLFGPMCPYCICMSVEVEYKPGGKQLDLGFVGPGPFGLMDNVGLDVVWDIEMVYYHESKDPKDHPPQALREKIEKGELGVKTGKGFYTYPNLEYRQPEFLNPKASISRSNY